MMRRIVLLVLVILAAAVAGQNLNGIYLGEDVTPGDPRIIAIQVTEDGTVIAFRDQVVPMMHDRYGKPVRIRKVELR